MTRQDAYKLVQRNSMEAWRKQQSFRELLKADQEVVTRLGEQGIDELFEYEYYLKHVDELFERAGLN
jgi:adenylosuccinate lyase